MIHLFKFKLFVVRHTDEVFLPATAKQTWLDWAATAPCMDWKKTFSHEDPLSTQFSKCWPLPLFATHTLRKTCRYVRAVNAVQ